jgi:hypothetical protein
MTTTVQMNTGMPGNGNVVVPGSPSGSSYTMTAGIVAVNAIDVPAAQRAGWQVMAGEDLAGKLFIPMNVPAGARGEIYSSPKLFTDGTVVDPMPALNFPDGTTVAITAGVANIPAAWVNWASQLGWTT